MASASCLSSNGHQQHSCARHGYQQCRYDTNQGICQGTEGQSFRFPAWQPIFTLYRMIHTPASCHYAMCLTTLYMGVKSEQYHALSRTNLQSCKTLKACRCSITQSRYARGTQRCQNTVACCGVLSNSLSSARPT